MIINFPLTFYDVKTLNLFLVLISPLLKGKSVMRKPASVVTDCVDIPREILEPRQELEVLTDITFINKLSFLVSIMKRLKFTTIEYLSSKN